MWQPLRLWLSGSYDAVRTIENTGFILRKKNSFTLEKNVKEFSVKRPCVLIETQRCVSIARTAQFFKSLGMPMTLREIGIDDSRLEEMAHHIAVNEGLDAPGTFAPLNEQDILSILKAAL